MTTTARVLTSIRVSSALVFAGMALASCASSSSGGPQTAVAVTKTIGPEGGTINVDGATVTFPPNALTAPTSITITPTDEAAPAGYTALSRVYHCAPSGTTFGEKVTMAMTFRGDPTGARMFWSSAADATFKDVGGTVVGQVMSAQVGHFSSGFVGKQR